MLVLVWRRSRMRGSASLVCSWHAAIGDHGSFWCHHIACTSPQVSENLKKSDLAPPQYLTLSCTILWVERANSTCPNENVHLNYGQGTGSAQHVWTRPRNIERPKNITDDESSPPSPGLRWIVKSRFGDHSRARARASQAEKRRGGESELQRKVCYLSPWVKRLKFLSFVSTFSSELLDLPDVFSSDV